MASSANDTGVKVTAMLFVNDDLAGDGEYGHVSLQGQENDKESTTDVTMRCGRMVLLKARQTSYSIQAKNKKVFVIMMKIGGPKGKEY